MVSMVKKTTIQRYLRLVKTYAERNKEVILALFLEKSNSPPKQIAKKSRKIRFVKTNQNSKEISGPCLQRRVQHGRRKWKTNLISLTKCGCCCTYLLFYLSVFQLIFKTFKLFADQTNNQDFAVI